VEKMAAHDRMITDLVKSTIVDLVDRI